MNIEIRSGKNMLAATINDSASTSPIGLAILLPGFCDSRRYPHIELLGRDLSQNNYTAVSFDATGMWESGGKTSEYTVTQYLDDIHEVRNFMVTREGRNIPNVVICGHSLGGMVGLLYSALDQSVSATAAIMSPSKFFDSNDQKVVDWRATGMKISLRDHPDDGQETTFSLPFSMWEDANRYDAGKAAQKISIPILFIAGGLDTGVLPGSVRKLYERAQGPKRLAIFSGINHNYRENAGHVAIVNKEIINFLSECDCIQ